MPELVTIPQVLGCLYVIEGATLGGQIITRHLQANLGITPETGGAFFAGYGVENGVRWQAFGAMITAAAAQFGGEDEIVASANRTFETLELWLPPPPHPANRALAIFMTPTPNTPPLPWADGAYSIKRHGVSLTNCDSEPIQMPGCSQAHGVVLVLRVSDLTILQLSENSATHLGLGPDELLGKSITTVVAAEGERRLRECLENEPIERNPLYVYTLPAREGAVALDLSLHTIDGLAVLECEPTAHDAAAAPDYYALVKKSVARMHAAQTLPDFCQIVADEVRSLTGLDRVMICTTTSPKCSVPWSYAARHWRKNSQTTMDSRKMKPCNCRRCWALPPMKWSASHAICGQEFWSTWDWKPSCGPPAQSSPSGRTFP